MIIYHIFTGKLDDILKLTIEEIINGKRPEIPDDVPIFLKKIILNCWEGDRENRHDISLICLRFKYKIKLLEFNEQKKLKKKD
jgi:hypothetical protein